MKEEMRAILPKQNAKIAASRIVVTRCHDLSSIDDRRASLLTASSRIDMQELPVEDMVLVELDLGRTLIPPDL